MIQSGYCSYVKIGGVFSFRCLDLHILSYKSKMTLASYFFCIILNFLVICTISLVGARARITRERTRITRKETVIVLHNKQTFKFLFQ